MEEIARSSLILCLGFLCAITSTSSAQNQSPDLVAIAPGTVVGRSGPVGWTHLVIKSIPRLTSGDLASLPLSAAKTASLFRTVIAANIEQDPKTSRFSLTQVGRGLCIPYAGRDEIIDPDSNSVAAKSLGIVDRIVLGQAFHELNRGKLVATSATFAIYRTPVAILMGREHRNILLCYILRLDPITGALTTGVWWTLDDPKSTLMAKSIIELPPSLLLNCGLDVRATRILGAVPVSWSFGMAALPSGIKRDLTPDLVMRIHETVWERRPATALELGMLLLKPNNP